MAGHHHHGLTPLNSSCSSVHSKNLGFMRYIHHPQSRTHSITVLGKNTWTLTFIQYFAFECYSYWSLILNSYLKTLPQNPKYNDFKNILSMCVYICAFTYIWRSEGKSRVDSLLPSLQWFQKSNSGLYSKNFYLLSQCSGPVYVIYSLIIVLLYSCKECDDIYIDRC